MEGGRGTAENESINERATYNSTTYRTPQYQAVYPQTGWGVILKVDDGKGRKHAVMGNGEHDRAEGKKLGNKPQASTRNNNHM